MSLEVQLQSLIYSFVFGVFFSYTVNLNYRCLFSSRRFVKLIINLLFVLVHVLLYFILLKLINSGVLHIYFFMVLVIGFLFGNYYSKKIRRY